MLPQLSNSLLLSRLHASLHELSSYTNGLSQDELTNWQALSVINLAETPIDHIRLTERIQEAWCILAVGVIINCWKQPIIAKFETQPYFAYIFLVHKAGDNAFDKSTSCQKQANDEFFFFQTCWASTSMICCILGSCLWEVGSERSTYVD